MAEEIEFENHHFWNFKSHVTLTLTSDDLESHIVVNVSSTLTNTTIWFVAALSLIVDVRTDGRTDERTYVCTDRRTFLLGLLGHLLRDDLKIWDSYQWHVFGIVYQSLDWLCFHITAECCWWYKRKGIWHIDKTHLKGLDMPTSANMVQPCKPS